MKTIKINDEIFNSLAKRAEEKEFKTAEEYIESILKQIVEKISSQKVQMSEEEEEKVKSRLRALGYMQ